MKILELVGLAQGSGLWARPDFRQSRGPVGRDHGPGPRMSPACGPQDADWPARTEWHWRPDLFQGHVTPADAPASGHRLCDNAALWHDCPHCALAVRPAWQAHATVTQSFRIETRDFGGSFLSVTLDLPDRILAMLGADHVVQFDVSMEADRPVQPYARINLVQGPNVETILRQMDDPTRWPGNGGRVAFDLAYGDLASRPIDRAWVDLIVEAPRMAVLTLHDVWISGRSRAQI